MKERDLRNNPFVIRVVDLALEEDIGHGDVTTETLIPPELLAIGRVVAKSGGVVAGLPVAGLVLERASSGRVHVEFLKSDGDEVAAGDVVLEAQGPARDLLKAERVLLNFLMRLSGVATKTRQYVQALSDTVCEVLCTRKTTPGLRILEKYAVAVGGGRNHRFGLYDGVLIKNNHLAMLGGDVKKAVKLARSRAPALCKVEVEVRSLDEAKRAVEAGADVICWTIWTKRLPRRSWLSAGSRRGSKGRET